MNLEKYPLFPYTQVIVGTGERIEENDLVEFRLLYEGALLCASSNNTRAEHKHVIRRIFHPQLRRLWSVQKNLHQFASQRGHVDVKEGESPNSPSYVITSPQERFERGLKAIGTNWNRLGYNWVPLVTPDMALRCSLDILLLRPEENRFIFKMGDIDGQVKTLFDALKIPENLGDVGMAGPGEGEDPFFCLLQDDRLISEVRVTSDQLLLLPGQRDFKATDSFVVIHVKLNHRSPRTFDNIFG